MQDLLAAKESQDRQTQQKQRRCQAFEDTVKECIKSDETNSGTNEANELR